MDPHLSGNAEDKTEKYLWNTSGDSLISKLEKLGIYNLFHSQKFNEFISFKINSKEKLILCQILESFTF